MVYKTKNLAEKFIAIKSEEGNKSALKEILSLALSQLPGFRKEVFKSNDIESALIYNRKTRPDKFKIILNAHLDIIPAKTKQYSPKIIGQRLYGAGAIDMKASAACLIGTFGKIANKIPYPLGLQLTTDEEIGGFDGTKFQIEKGVRTDFIITGEPTNFDIINEAKGILRLRILARGKTAHGAYPWRGDNAIWKMVDFLKILERKFPALKEERWETTCNLSRIETANTAWNKIPDDCAVNLDIRFIPKDRKKILREIKKILPKGFAITLLGDEPSLATDRQNPYIKNLQIAGKSVLKKNLILRRANGSSDARHFAAIGCPGIEFGPIGGGIGSDEEWVDIPSLEKYSKILESFLLSLK